MQNYFERVQQVTGISQESALQLQPESYLDQFIDEVEMQLWQTRIPAKFVTLLRELSLIGYAFAIPYQHETYFLGRHGEQNYEIIYLPEPVEFCLLVFKWHQELAKRVPHSEWAARRIHAYALVDVTNLEQELIECGDEYDPGEILEQKLFAIDDIADFYRLNVMFGATDLDRVNPIPYLRRQIQMLESLWEQDLSSKWENVAGFENGRNWYDLKVRSMPALPEMESIQEIQVALCTVRTPLFKDRLHNLRGQAVSADTFYLYAVQAPDYQGVFERELPEEYVERALDYPQTQMFNNAFEVRRRTAARRLNKLMRGQGAPSARMALIAGCIYLHDQGYQKLILRSPSVGFPQHQNPYVDSLFEENIQSLIWVIEKLAEGCPELVNYDSATGEITCDLNLIVEQITHSPRYSWLKFGAEV